MISGYNDHAANERTFLAWIRTGIAVIAFGFLVEKFNLFLLTLAAAGMSSDARRPQLAMLSGRIEQRAYRAHPVRSARARGHELQRLPGLRLRRAARGRAAERA
jgi:hypothetical protein